MTRMQTSQPKWAQVSKRAKCRASSQVSACKAWQTQPQVDQVSNLHLLATLSGQIRRYKAVPQNIDCVFILYLSFKTPAVVEPDLLNFKYELRCFWCCDISYFPSFSLVASSFHPAAMFTFQCRRVRTGVEKYFRLASLVKANDKQHGGHGEIGEDWRRRPSERSRFDWICTIPHSTCTIIV